jgi:hypothetical protein
MSLSSAVKAMSRTHVVLGELIIQEERLVRASAHLEELRRKEREITDEEDLTEEDMQLYSQILRWKDEVENAEQEVAAWKAELATSRPPFFSEEEVAALKANGSLSALLNELERADAAKIPHMLQMHGADFVAVAKWAIKDRYFWNGLCPW